MAHYECNCCGLQRDIRDSQKFYSLGEGRLFPMHDTHMWCSTCQDISVCERSARPFWRVKQSDDELQRAFACRWLLHHRRSHA
jgi:hypothetical protein